MTRLSTYLLPTEKQAPADAEAISHKLMVRAGLVRQLGAGLWTWMPAGWRIQQRVQAILREEMDAIGAQEMLMPVLHPADPWKRSGRYDIVELLKLQDRKGADMVLAMTHEEIVTTHVAQVVRSYRDLPLILYHLQTKERDEPRPRAGVLRTREFTMKDAYSFDRDEEGLDVSYGKHIVAYDRIFDRAGLRVVPRRVRRRDDGRLRCARVHGAVRGGRGRGRARAGYAANVEVASADPQPVQLPAPLGAPQEVHTPGLTTVEEVAGDARRARRRAAEGLPGDRRGTRAGARRRARRPPRQRDQAAQRARRRLPPGPAGGVRAKIGPAGFIGPVGANVPVLLDAAVAATAAT